jgi:hypothetical protein
MDIYSEVSSMCSEILNGSFGTPCSSISDGGNCSSSERKRKFCEESPEEFSKCSKIDSEFRGDFLNISLGSNQDSPNGSQGSFEESVTLIPEEENYDEEVFEHNKKRETKYLFKEIPKAYEGNWANSRTRLVDWMLALCSYGRFELEYSVKHEEIYFKAVKIADRVLSSGTIELGNWQAVGAVSVALAS